MSEFSSNVRLLVNQLASFYEQVALLLQSSDAIFDEYGWKSDNTAINGSNVLHLPQEWLARVMHRFYRNESGEHHLLPFVSIILAEPGREDRIPEPVLCAGFFEYDDLTKYTYYHWWARLYVWVEQAAANGELVQADSSVVKWKVPWDRVSLLAVPLETVTTTDHLKNILDPVIRAIREGNADGPMPVIA